MATISGTDTIRAKIVDRMFLTALQQPIYLVNYFENGNSTIINISFDLINEVPIDPIPERIQLLAALFSQHPLTEAEFSMLYHICFCKLNFNGLPESQKSKMHALQISTYQKLATKMTDINQFQQLTILSHEFVTIFYANL